MALDNEKPNVAVNAARAGKQIVTSVVSATKEFFNELVHPNMTIEKIAEVAAPSLDDLIEKNEANGLKYTAGKFKIEYVDEKQFALSFEMYFKDADGKWYKSGGNSEPREAELLDIGSWKTLQTLKAVEFPISAPSKEEAADNAVEPKVEEKIEAIAESKVEEKIETTTEPKVEDKPESTKQEITLEDLLTASKIEASKKTDSKINLDKD